MASVNKVIVLGNLGQDPETRYMPNGMAVCNISVATSRHWKSKESGERQEETEWHRVVFYDRLAEIAGEYCKKGKPVYVEGRLKTRKWQDKDGTDKYTTEIIAESMQLLGGRDDGDSGQGSRTSGGGQSGYSRERSGSGTPSRGQPPSQRQQGNGGGSARAKTGTGFDDMDDDIPFVTACASFDLVPSLTRRVRRVA